MNWDAEQTILFLQHGICAWLNITMDTFLKPFMALENGSIFMKPFVLGPFVSTGLRVGPFQKPYFEQLMPMEWAYGRAVTPYSLEMHSIPVLTPEEMFTAVMNAVMAVLSDRRYALGDIQCLLVDRYGVRGVAKRFLRVTMEQLGFERIKRGFYRKWLRHLPGDIDIEAAQILDEITSGVDGLRCEEKMVH